MRRGSEARVMESREREKKGWWRGSEARVMESDGGVMESIKRAREPLSIDLGPDLVFFFFFFFLITLEPRVV